MRDQLRFLLGILLVAASFTITDLIPSLALLLGGLAIMGSVIVKTIRP